MPTSSGSPSTPSWWGDIKNQFKTAAKFCFDNYPKTTICAGAAAALALIVGGYYALSPLFHFLSVPAVAAGAGAIAMPYSGKLRPFVRGIVLGLGTYLGLDVAEPLISDAISNIPNVGFALSDLYTDHSNIFSTLAGLAVAFRAWTRNKPWSLLKLGTIAIAGLAMVALLYNMPSLMPTMGPSSGGTPASIAGASTSLSPVWDVIKTNWLDAFGVIGGGILLLQRQATISTTAITKLFAAALIGLGITGQFSSFTSNLAGGVQTASEYLHPSATSSTTGSTATDCAVRVVKYPNSTSTTPNYNEDISATEIKEVTIRRPDRTEVTRPGQIAVRYQDGEDWAWTDKNKLDAKRPACPAPSDRRSPEIIVPR